MPPSQLQIAEVAARPLTAEQRKFNQLVQKVERARAELQAWQEHEALFAAGHATQVRPLLAEMAACRMAVATRLDGLLKEPGWTKAETRTMRELLVDLAGSLVEDESVSPEQSEAMKALHDRHADLDFDSGNREAMTAMKDMFEMVSGVDLGDAAFESEEQMLAHAGERMREQFEARQAAADARPRRQTAAQRRRAQEAEQASQSLREVYRKLASALHPDRADDEADRVTRTALMQRVNQAYEAQDLLALFALQLEIEQIDAEHLARATAERARHYNHVLASQLAELQDELRGRHRAFRMEYGLEPFERLAANRLGALLLGEVGALRATLAHARADMRRLEQPADVKRWLKQQRQLMRDDMPF